MSDRAARRWTCRTAALIAGAIAIYHFSWLPYQANRVVYEVYQRSEKAGSSGDPIVAMPIARTNLSMLDSVGADSRKNSAYHLLYAQNALLLRRMNLALQHYDDALALDRRPEIFMERGFLEIESGRVDRAVPDFVRAVLFDPALLEQLGGQLRERVRLAAGVK